MKTVIKKIDKLGRIVLPLDYRKILNLCENSEVALCIEKNKIMIFPSGTSCKICGLSERELDENLGICKKCINKVKLL